MYTEFSMAGPSLVDQASPQRRLTVSRRFQWVAAMLLLVSGLTMVLAARNVPTYQHSVLTHPFGPLLDLFWQDQLSWRQRIAFDVEGFSMMGLMTSACGWFFARSEGRAARRDRDTAIAVPRWAYSGTEPGMAVKFEALARQVERGRRESVAISVITAIVGIYSSQISDASLHYLPLVVAFLIALAT